MSRFKVNDKVRIISGPDSGHFVGDIGTVIEVGGASYNVLANDCVGLYYDDELELVEDQSAFARQEGGSHYKDFAIQPTEYIVKNGLGFVEGNIVKYVTRYKKKGGLEDLKKARHYLDILIELEQNGS